MNADNLVVKSTLTVRLIRSFEHRNIKHIVLRDVDLTWKSSQFMEYVNLRKLLNNYVIRVILITATNYNGTATDVK